MPVEAFDLLPKIAWHMDEPFGDPILLPIYLLSEHASETVKVVLTGDGADETQLGYIHHESLSRGFSIAKFAGSWLFSLAGRLARGMPVSFLDLFFRYPGSMGIEGRERLSALCGCMGHPSQAYQLFASLFTEAERRRLYGPALASAMEGARDLFYDPVIGKFDSAETPLRAIYLHDLRHWLPDNILNKQDRMTMAHSVEGRVPFLDHRLVEFLVSLPMQLKIRNGRGKRLLRELFDRHYSVPGRAANEKQAFVMPIEGRYESAYNKLVAAYLECSIEDNGLFDQKAVLEVVEAGRRSPLLGHKKVMALIMFQMWLQVFKVEW